MTPELKAKWVEALRKYPKTSGNLKDNEGYCCLGVLLDIAGGGFSDKYAHEDYSGRVEPIPFTPNNISLTSGQELSNHALDVFGLERAIHDDLTNINDSSDTFDPVIEYIEANL